MMVDNIVTSTPDLSRLRNSFGGSNNSPLRRRSRVHQTRAPPSRAIEVRNDDDAERSSLIASERALASSSPISSPRRPRDTMSSSPQKEHFQGCLKLYAENKINKDNAWNLQLIDFMSSMLRRHDARMENLQTASTVVDASARIYSIRVDAVHNDVLKIAGGLCKAAQAKRGKKDDDGMSQDEGGADGDAPAAQKKKKKRSKGAIATNPETLNGDFDCNECIDSFFDRLAATAGDVTSSNRAFNVTLPVSDKTLSLVLGTDEPFLHPLEENAPEELNLTHKITVSVNLVPGFYSSDHICEPFTGFSIYNWDPDNEDEGHDRLTNWIEENRLNLSQQAMAIDVNADVEPIPLDEVHNDLLDDEPLGGIESDDEADAGVAVCCARVAAAAPMARLTRLTDARPTGAADARLEYSYCGAVVAPWAGPQHWRLKNNRASKQNERTQSTAGGRTAIEGNKKAPRTKRQLDFTGVGLAFDSQAEPTGEYEPTQPVKIMISRKTLSTGHTWNEANFRTPVDRGLDESHFRKLFLRRSVIMLTKKELERSKRQPPKDPVTVDDPQDYNYNNDNDASYCPSVVQEGDDWANEDGAAAGDLHDQMAHQADGLGDMIEPPTKVAKIFIPYAMRAKKVDMKQLKHSTWRLLTEQSPLQDNQNVSIANEDVKPTTFMSVYTKLPSKLSGSTKESLSVPLALLSVLHLANEKGLILEKHEDLKDFGILGLIK